MEAALVVSANALTLRGVLRICVGRVAAPNNGHWCERQSQELSGLSLHERADLILLSIARFTATYAAALCNVRAEGKTVYIANVEVFS